MGAQSSRGVGSNRCTIQLHHGDSELQKAEQFARLRSHVLEPQAAVIFHLSNHYALIFGLREWRDEAGEVGRQVLTARKGQRPSAWIDFNEVRDIMLNANSYKMILVTCKNKKQAMTCQRPKTSLGLTGSEACQVDA